MCQSPKNTSLNHIVIKPVSRKMQQKIQLVSNRTQKRLVFFKKSARCVARAGRNFMRETFFVWGDALLCVNLHFSLSYQLRGFMNLYSRYLILNLYLVFTTFNFNRYIFNVFLPKSKSSLRLKRKPYRNISLKFGISLTKIECR